MTMTSGQCDELRNLALWLDDEFYDAEASKVRQAVDTIWELRKLCIDFFDRLMDKDEHCGECRSECEYDAWNFGDPKCVYAKRMQKLGIEVQQ